VFKKLHIFVQGHEVNGQMLLDNTFINTLQRFISSRQDWSRFTDYRSKLLDTIQTTTEPTRNKNPKIDISSDQNGGSPTNTPEESVKDLFLQDETPHISVVDKRVRILMLTTDVIDIQQ
jgi:hypothetical protein